MVTKEKLESMSLIEEINSKSKEISTDKYSMSIGEIISMYKDGDLDIHPEFQRFFRWTNSQKTKLIESFLLNIPVPSVFVSQREDGIWDVVDGLQRLSTILQFVGIYKDEHGNILEPICLEATDMLPSLNGKFYEKEDDEENSFSPNIRRYFKRTKLDFVIIKKESDETSKYEIFQRLNTGGTQLSDQEVRNCIMVMEDDEKFKKLQSLSQNEHFLNTLRLADKSFEERFDLELVTRFICLRHEKMEILRGVQDFGDYLDKKIVDIFRNKNFDWENEVNVFEKCFRIIDESLGDCAFLKYDTGSQKFKGRFYTSAFEFVAIGLGRRNGNIPDNFSLKHAIIDLWNHIIQDEISWKGYNAAGRISKTIQLANEIYGNEQD